MQSCRSRNSFKPVYTIHLQLPVNISHLAFQANCYFCLSKSCLSSCDENTYHCARLLHLPVQCLASPIGVLHTAADLRTRFFWNVKKARTRVTVKFNQLTSSLSCSPTFCQTWFNPTLLGEAKSGENVNQVLNCLAHVVHLAENAIINGSCIINL